MVKGPHSQWSPGPRWRPELRPLVTELARMIRTSYRSTAEEDEEEDSLPNSQTMVDTFVICQSFNFETIGAVDACLVTKSLQWEQH